MSRAQPGHPRKKILMHLFMHIGKLLESMVREQLQVHGVHHAQGRVLSILDRHGPMTQANLSRGMFVKPATTTTILKPMEKQGWIERRLDPVSGRARIVSLTDRGRALAREVELAWQRVEEQIRQTMSEEEYRASFGRLEGVRDGLGGRAPMFRPHEGE